MRLLRTLVILVGAGGFASVASAAGESVQFTNVNSNGPLGSGVNGVRSHTFTGGFNVSRIRVTGTFVELNTATLASEAAVQVTAPSGETVIIQPLPGTGDFEGQVVANRVLEVFTDGTFPSEVGAAGLWTFRFFESFDNAGEASIDGRWNSVSIELSSAVSDEVEGNDSKGEARSAFMLGDGEELQGTTLGPGPGVSGPDYFLVSSPPAEPGIYMNTLRFAAGGAGKTLGIRGDSQTGGVIARQSDVLLQPKDLADKVTYYSFGTPERVYVRVSGGNPDNAAYTLEKDIVRLEPQHMGEFQAGELSLFVEVGLPQDIAGLWVYDADFKPIPGYGARQVGQDAASGLRRVFVPGVYYVAVAPGGVANHLPSPADDPVQDRAVLDFPGAVAATTVTSGFSGGIQPIVEDGSGAIGFFTTSRFSAQILWGRFTVVDPSACRDPDFNQDGALDIFDIEAFFQAFSGGC